MRSSRLTLIDRHVTPHLYPAQSMVKCADLSHVLLHSAAYLSRTHLAQKGTRIP